MVGAAFNPMANMYVPDFIKQFQPNFPVGSLSRETTLEYLQHSPIMNFYVPIVVFIDRQGIIRHQYLGDNPFFQNQEKNIRDTIEALLKAPAGKKAAPAAKKSAAPAAKKKAS